MNDQSLQFTAIRLVQPIGEIFVAKISSDKLAGLAKADIRRITARDLEKMSGIQRGLNPNRVSDIAKYIETVDASFPNTFILNLNSEFLNSYPREIENDCGEGAGLFCFDITSNERFLVSLMGSIDFQDFKRLMLRSLILSSHFSSICQSKIRRIYFLQST